MRSAILLISLFLSLTFSVPTFSQTQYRFEIPRNIFDYKNVRSCQEIKQINPNATSGYEVIFPQGFFAPSVEVFCDQTTDGGGWTRIVSYNQSSDGCLTNYNEIGGDCLKTPRIDTQDINVLGIEYREVRGNVVVQQYASTNAFRRFNASSLIDDIYIDGVSFTYRDSNLNRQHIFSYAIAISNSVIGDDRACPAAGGATPPVFVGSNFYCESGNPSATWELALYQPKLFLDKEFSVSLTQPTRSPIEMRVMNDEYIDNESVALYSYYVFIR